MAVPVCLTLILLFLSATWTQDLPVKRGSCDRTALEADFKVTNCQLNGDLVISPRLTNGSTCFVTCKLMDVSTGRGGWRRCDLGNWIGQDIDCDSALNNFKNAPKVTKLLHIRKKRWWSWWAPIICWVFGCRRLSSPDRTPPSLKCPGDLTAYNEPLQTHAKFTWIEPIAVDNVDGSITPRRGGPGPGRLFASNATIRYAARDSSGNLAYCSFKINIIVIRCPPPTKIANGHFRCHPSTDFVKGGKCVFGCYSGHKLEGPSEVTCQDTWRWSDSFPECNKIECDILLPPPHATMDCSDGFKFSSVCTFTCVKEGYAVPAGRRRVQVCRADGTWSGETPSCVDVTPPLFSKCHHVVIATAERNSDKARVAWIEPQVKDNSGERITALQTKGRSSGSEFTVGHHDIEYTATDSAGNIARKCQFKVVVKELLCHALYATPYQTVTCPHGYRYGSQCTFDCDPDFSLAGSNVTSCEVMGSPSYGTWSFAKQPECKVANACPKLRVPSNGAIVCDEWYQGVFCQLHCQNGTDISPYFPHWELFICGTSGVWNINKDLHLQIPDCLARGSGALVRYTMGARYYYNGNCHDPSVQQEIKANLIDLLEDHPACLNVPECKVENVQVHCGEIRTRREANGKALSNKRNRRDTDQSNILDIEVEFQFKSQSDDVSAVDTWKSLVYTVTSDTVHSGHLTVDGLLLTTGEVTTKEISTKCENGSVISYKTYRCIKCPLGSFHNVTGRSCDLCQKGRYQDQEGHTDCIDCPVGTTTRLAGTKYQTDCQVSCASGTFSKTGLPQCSPCPHGFYQPGTGQTQCVACPGVKTTVSQGAVSADLCEDFDITHQSNDVNVPSVTSLDVNINVTLALTVSFWVKCSNNCQDTTLLTLDTNNKKPWFILEAKADFRFTTESTQTDSTAALITNQWQFLVLTLTPTSVILRVDGQKSGSVDHAGFSFINIQELILGGSRFAGKVSQFQMWGPSFSWDAIERTCSSAKEGDVLSWKRFTDAKLQGAYVEIPSQCDEQNDCATNPCENGQCQDVIGSFSCQCDLGWTGTLCDVNENDCPDVNVCENNGVCVDDVKAFHCACADGFGGDVCEIAIVNGNWGMWSNWTSCNVDCGQGSHTRSRMCDNPYPNNGGRECQGETIQNKTCEMPDCTECPTLDPPTNGNIRCDVVSGAINCSVSCDDDYMFDKEPLEQYICSVDTLHTWNIQTDLNPLGRLPYCSKLQEAKSLGITYIAVYLNTGSLSCSDISEHVSSIKAKLTDIMQTATGCFGSQSCRIQEVKVNWCQERLKRDTSSKLDFAVDISVDSGSEDSASLLETAYKNIQEVAEMGMLEVNIGNGRYDVDVNATSTTPTIDCEPGHTTYSFWCLPCGAGSYYTNGLCEWCPVGLYQPMEAQSHCITCSPGWTTIGYGSRSDGDCNVELEMNKTVTDDTVHFDVPKSIMYGLVSTLGVLVSVVLLIITGLVCRSRRRVKAEPQWTSSKLSLKSKSTLSGQSDSNRRPGSVISYVDVDENNR